MNDDMAAKGLALNEAIGNLLEEGTTPSYRSVSKSLAVVRAAMAFQDAVIADCRARLRLATLPPKRPWWRFWR